MVRIRSEHAIGFLKGRFQSLKSLRVNIFDENTHKFATYWAVACIAIHTFALRHELDAKDSDYDAAKDPFVAAGILTDTSSDQERTIRRGRVRRGPRNLEAAKARRLDLKRAILRKREEREERRRRRGAGEFQSDEEDSS